MRSLSPASRGCAAPPPAPGAPASAHRERRRPRARPGPACAAQGADRAPPRPPAPQSRSLSHADAFMRRAMAMIRRSKSASIARRVRVLPNRSRSLASLHVARRSDPIREAEPIDLGASAQVRSPRGATQAEERFFKRAGATRISACQGFSRFRDPRAEAQPASAPHACATFAPRANCAKAPRRAPL